MPAYITTPQQPSRPAASKFLSWRQAVHRNSSGTPLLFQQYVEALTHELRELYLTQTQVEELETEFEEKLQRWIPIRDELLEVFAFWAGEPPLKSGGKYWVSP
jgi:hypothetical protein